MVQGIEHHDCNYYKLPPHSKPILFVMGLYGYVVTHVGHSVRVKE